MGNLRLVKSLGQLVEHLCGLAEPCIVAIDGGGGAGKSTLAAALCSAWPGSAVIHTDDFAAWDNPMDWWPRLLDEALVPLYESRTARFQKNDWENHCLGEWETVTAPRVVIEGVSSSRSEFRPYLRYCIWIETGREERLRRGLERDGEQALDLWRNWMVAEDEYMRTQTPRERADLVLNGEDAFGFISA